MGIEEFFMIERNDIFDLTHMSYSLLLPDVSSEDDIFVKCGDISCIMSKDGIYDVIINLSDNFRSLCDNEALSQEHIGKAIIYLISNDIGVSFENERLKVMGLK